MPESIRAGARVRTTVALPMALSADNLRAPAGTEGIVQRVFGDALGGFQVDLVIDEAITPAVAYANQISIIDP